MNPGSLLVIDATICRREVLSRPSRLFFNQHDPTINTIDVSLIVTWQGFSSNEDVALVMNSTQCGWIRLSGTVRLLIASR